MAINSTLTTFNPTLSNSTTITSKNDTKTGQERDMFLKLLVAQLKNQDPLQPQDGMQFVEQLTQFSSLDQLISIKQGIEELLGKK